MTLNFALELLQLLLSLSINVETVFRAATIACWQRKKGKLSICNYIVALPPCKCVKMLASETNWKYFQLEKCSYAECGGAFDDATAVKPQHWYLLNGKWVAEAIMAHTKSNAHSLLTACCSNTPFLHPPLNESAFRKINRMLRLYVITHQPSLLPLFLCVNVFFSRKQLFYCNSMFYLNTFPFFL